jgi:hypothetical protein
MKVDIFVHVKAMILTAIFFIKASKSHPYKTSFINLARHPNGNETISKIDLIVTTSRILLTYNMRELSLFPLNPSIIIVLMSYLQSGRNGILFQYHFF